MTVTQEDVIFETLSSTNQRLMRECQEFLSSVDKSDVQAPVQTSAAGPRAQPQSTTSSVNPRQQRQDCGVILERSAEDCENKSGRSNEAQSAEDYDNFDMKLHGLDNTIDTALNNLQAQSQPAEYEYYNDPKYQRQTRDHSIDEDSLVAMAKRLDDASILSDPSVICGTREKLPLITNQPYNRKSPKSFPEKTRSGNRGERSTHSRRSSNGSSASSSSSHLPRNERVQSSYTENVDNKSQPPIPRTQCKDNDKGAYIKRASSRQPMPPPPPPKEYRKRIPVDDGAASVPSEQVELESRRKRSSTPAGSGCTQTIPPRTYHSDFRSRSNAKNTSQDFDTDEDEDSDHTEFFYESTDDDDSSSDEYDPRAVGSSVADAVKDLNNQRGLKRVMKLFGKKSKGDEDMWSVATQR